MTMFQTVGAASDRVMAALVAGLELEFGSRAAEGLAQRFLAAEECDFTWDARDQERWIGSYEVPSEDDLQLDRMAMMGRLDGRWIVAVCIVDGDGRAHGMTAKRTFGRAHLARRAFAEQR
ncbi:MAG: hypothetical protein V4472_24345 [Pseudomonadota bacterium]